MILCLDSVGLTLDFGHVALDGLVWAAPRTVDGATYRYHTIYTSPRPRRPLKRESP